MCFREIPPIVGPRHKLYASCTVSGSVLSHCSLRYRNRWTSHRLYTLAVVSLVHSETVYTHLSLFLVQSEISVSETLHLCCGVSSPLRDSLPMLSRPRSRQTLHSCCSVSDNLRDYMPMLFCPRSRKTLHSCLVFPVHSEDICPCCHVRGQERLYTLIQCFRSTQILFAHAVVSEVQKDSTLLL